MTLDHSEDHNTLSPAPDTNNAKCDINAELFRVGITLVFCDDSDIAEQPVPSLRPDLRVLVAVQITSDSYRSLNEAIASALTRFNVHEFHATDIATGNGAWKERSENIRLEALRHLADLFSQYALRVGAVWLPKQQYPTLRQSAKRFGRVNAGFKQGLKRVLVRGLAERLAAGTRPAMLWLDQDKPICEAKVEDWPEARFLVGGGPIVAPSHSVSGLQVADLAAWSVQRYLVRRNRFDNDSASDFDHIALEVVAGFPGGLDDLRGDDYLYDWAP